MAEPIVWTINSHLCKEIHLEFVSLRSEGIVNILTYGVRNDIFCLQGFVLNIDVHVLLCLTGALLVGSFSRWMKHEEQGKKARVWGYTSRRGKFQKVDVRT